MKTTSVLLATIAMFLSSNTLFAQWNFPLQNTTGSITVKDFANGDREIKVTGSAWSDEVEVQRWGSNAMVILRTNGNVVASKLVRPLSQISFGAFAGTRPNSIPNLQPELVLNCELGGGDDMFSCDSSIFDLVAVSGGSGNDVIYAAPSATWAFGEEGNDYLIGGDHQAAVLDGGDGNDFVVGGKGDDFLLGGEGSDYLSSRAASSTDGSDIVRTDESFLTFDTGIDDEVGDYYQADSTDELRRGTGDYGIIVVFVD